MGGVSGGRVLRFVCVPVACACQGRCGERAPPPATQDTQHTRPNTARAPPQRPPPHSPVDAAVGADRHRVDKRDHAHAGAERDRDRAAARQLIGSVGCVARACVCFGTRGGCVLCVSVFWGAPAGAQRVHQLSEEERGASSFITRSSPSPWRARARSRPPSTPTAWRPACCGCCRFVGAGVGRECVAGALALGGAGREARGVDARRAAQPPPHTRPLQNQTPKHRTHTHRNAASTWNVPRLVCMPMMRGCSLLPKLSLCR